MAIDTTSTNNGESWMRSTAATSNLNGDPNKLGWRSDPLTDHKLIKWTLPNLSGTITQVSLIMLMEVNEDSQNGIPVGIYESTRSFDTNTATWNTYDGSNNWTTPGG